MKLSKLLLVEDNQEAADLITSILEYVGHKIVHKTNGTDALKAFQSENFDGILLDYMLPDTDGMTLCRTMRQSNKEIPIILTSAHGNNLTEEELFDAGVTAFVPKPISEHIVHTISKVVRTQSMIRVELKEPTNWVKRVLGPYYAD